MANQWQQVSVTGEPLPEKQWKIRIYLDGKLLKEGTTPHLTNPLSLAGSLVLGTELFYFHDSYYRGLIGRRLSSTRF